MSEKGWIQVPGTTGNEVAVNLQRAVEARISNREYSQDNVDYIKRINRSLVHTISGGDERSGEARLSISDDRMQRLRRLCQLWEIELKVGEFKSHRRFIGSFIVAGKRLLVPIIRMILKDTLRQQRDFNAAAILLLTDLSEEVERLRHQTNHQAGSCKSLS